MDKQGRHLANFGTVTDAYGFMYKYYPEDGLKNPKSNPPNNGFYTTKFASFPVTTYGLYDLAGNVAEWTEDGFSDNYVFKKIRQDQKMMSS